GQFNCYSSTISGNKALSLTGGGRGGGGIIAQGSALLSGCTVDSNLSDFGGGLGQYSGDSFEIRNSTISGNSGGGVVTNSTTTIVNSTVAYNTVFGCAGVCVQGNVTLHSSILTRNGNNDLYAS